MLHYCYHVKVFNNDFLYTLLQPILPKWLEVSDIQLNRGIQPGDWKKTCSSWWGTFISKYKISFQQLENTEHKTENLVSLIDPRLWKLVFTEDNHIQCKIVNSKNNEIFIAFQYSIHLYGNLERSSSSQGILSISSEIPFHQSFLR